MSKKKKEPKRDIANEIDEFECRIKEVSEEEFWIYKEVRDEGIIPIYEMRNLAEATGLDINKILIISDNYIGLCRKFDKGLINKKKKVLK